MGYDCTLHVVDEKAIRERFVPKLLGRSKAHSPFDERDDAGDLWEEVRTALSKGIDGEGDSIGPDDQASLVTQLAVVYAAAEHPSHYERGVCLSLWEELPDGLAAKVPKKHLGDPEDLFTEVIAEYPDLKGAFPQGIRSNWCTGFYVPSEKVPELLKWVERRVKRYPKPDQRLFRGLLLILKHAADNGLAYWEGTDLPVADAIPVAPATPRRTDLEDIEAPENIHLDYIGGDGHLLAFSHSIGFPQDCRTAIMDFSTWPPTHTIIPEYALSADRSPDGQWVTVSMTSEQAYVYQARVGPIPGERKLLVPADKSIEKVRHAGFVGDRVVAVTSKEGWDPADKEYVPPVPLIDEGGRLVRIEGLPAKPERPDAYGFGRLGDGTGIFFWNGDGYELRGDTFERTFPIEANTFASEFLTIPLESDGFFYTSSRGLYSVFRGLERARHLKHLDNIMYISPGPEGSILLKEGDNKRGDLGKLYFPEENTYICITPELFEDEDPDNIRTLHWIESCGRLVAATTARFWAVPIESVLSLPRHDARTGKKLREGVTPKKSKSAFTPEPTGQKPEIRVVTLPHHDFDFITPMSRHGSTLYFSAEGDDEACMLTVDASGDTLSFEKIDTSIKDLAQSRSGRCVAAISGDERSGTPPVYVGETVAGPWKVLPPTDDPNARTVGIGLVNDRPAVCISPPPPDSTNPADRLWHLMLEDNGKLNVVEELEAQDRRLRFAVIQLGDGSDVVLWGDVGYELRNGRFEKTFVFDLPDGLSEDPAALGPDSLIYASREKNRPVFYRVRRNEQAERCALKLKDDIMSISPGPGVSVFVADMYQGTDKLGILYFPDDETYLRIPYDFFEGKISGSVNNFWWDEPTDRMVVYTNGQQVLTAAMDHVLNLPRFNAKTNRPLKK